MPVPLSSPMTGNLIDAPPSPYYPIRTTSVIYSNTTCKPYDETLAKLKSEFEEFKPFIRNIKDALGMAITTSDANLLAQQQPSLQEALGWIQHARSGAQTLFDETLLSPFDLKAYFSFVQELEVYQEQYNLLQNQFSYHMKLTTQHYQYATAAFFFFFFF